MSDTPEAEVIEYSPEETALRDALRAVLDPELGMSVVELGLIRKANFMPDLTELTVIMTTPFCPYGPALIEQIRRTAEQHLKTPVKLTLGMEMWEPSMMEGGPPAEWGLY
ncbi:MAG TPA: iron-sulfur cluster assembly protein [Anaerolineae bacterium]|nr:iron-sulfur cluster assembly protein [Anaerolineae bacterium]